MKIDNIGEITSNFCQTFNFNENTKPHGISMEELMTTTCYLESYPRQFSYSFGGSKDIIPFEQYQKFLNFIQNNPKYSRLRYCLFPLFCNFILW